MDAKGGLQLPSETVRSPRAARAAAATVSAAEALRLFQGFGIEIE
jgi:hypothetical protein